MKFDLQTLIGRLPLKYRWTVHNLIGHPLSELLAMCGYVDLGDAVHERTMPPGMPVRDSAKTARN